MQESPTPFYAIADERLSRAGAWSRVDSQLFLAIIVAACLYAALFAVLFYENGLGFSVTSEREEIPVEIVVEPPPIPTPPPPPAPELPQVAQPDEEKPAFDSPRAGNNDKRDDEKAADAAKPSGAPPPPSESPPVPAPTPEAVAPPAPPLPTAAEAEAPAFADTEPRPPPEKPDPKPPAQAPAKPMLNFASVPDLDFGGAALYAPVSGGAAKATYLSILHGLIVPRMRVPASARTYGRRLHGAVDFAVDARGRLTERWVAESSGSDALDEAAMAAIAAAAPLFPPPPRGSSRSVRFAYTTE
jgi:protein TonB